MSAINKLVLIGNGFDLAHGLKTSYKDFLDWYMCESLKANINHKGYSDILIEMKSTIVAEVFNAFNLFSTIEDVEKLIKSGDSFSIVHKSPFFSSLITSFKNGKWVDIEHYYFKILTQCFNNINMYDETKNVPALNKEFNFIIQKLSEYIQIVNKEIANTSTLELHSTKYNIRKAFPTNLITSKIKYLNFNYTETLCTKGYADEKDVIHIHGRADHATFNPIIFGYGDETDSAYQRMEDSGENMYLEHIKSFGYLKTNNYANLISYIDSAPYTVYIVGHSCGLSDRILLNEIFEHTNCEKIEIFYYRRPDETDNFTEITQEISRHFKPQNKGMMRRRIATKSDSNIIPQN